MSFVRVRLLKPMARHLAKTLPVFYWIQELLLQLHSRVSNVVKRYIHCTLFLKAL